MSRHGRLSLSRRAFAGLLLQAAALWGGRAAARDPNAADRGLGGTGVVPVDPDETLGQDRGIGGTGVVGTIRRFGSIVVNDLRVTFQSDVKVSIDGRPTTLADLKVGHVVRVLARPRRGGLTTRAIVAQSEVVGPAEAPSAEGSLVVLGQRVTLAEGVTLPAHRPGDLLAVSGLRRIDGTIVASLVERRPAGSSRLHGPVEPNADGAPAVGTLRIDGLAPALIGRRVSLVGTLRGDAFRATSVTVEPAVPFAAADRLSVEAYVARVPDGLRLGSGLDMTAGTVALSSLAAHEVVRAVVTARPGPSGRLDAESLRVEHESRGAGRSGDRSGPGPGAPDGAGRPGRAGGPEGPFTPSGTTNGGRGDGPGFGPAGGPGGGRGGLGPAGGPAGGGPGGGGPAGGGPAGGGPGGNGPGR